MTGNNARLVAAFVAGAVITAFAIILLTSRRDRQLEGRWSDEQFESLYVAQPRQLGRPAVSRRD